MKDFNYYRNLDIKVTPDAYTSDENVKQKFRSVNLIKYNPHLFTNRTDKYEMMGGDRTLFTTLALGTLFLLYRRKVNQVRELAKREGIWLYNIWFLYGSSVGLFYSAIYFFKWQMIMNGMTAYYLLERHPKSASINRKNIYRLKDKENTDESYRFTDGFKKTFHL
jgi:hypothetical protein